MPQDATELGGLFFDGYLIELTEALINSLWPVPHQEFPRFSQLCPLRMKLSCCHQKGSRLYPRHLVYVHSLFHAQDLNDQTERQEGEDNFFLY